MIFRDTKRKPYHKKTLIRVTEYIFMQVFICTKGKRIKCVLHSFQRCGQRKREIHCYRGEWQTHQPTTEFTKKKNIKHYNGSMYGCARLTANKYMINREKMQPTLLSRLQMKIQSKVIDLHIAQYFHFFYFFTAIYQPLKKIHFRMSSSFVERWLFFVPLSHEFERLWFLYIHIHDTLYYATITPFIQVYNMCV